MKTNDALEYAKKIAEIHGDDPEQIEAHMESWGYSQEEIDDAIDTICGVGWREYEMVIVGPSGAYIHPIN